MIEPNEVVPNSASSLERNSADLVTTQMTYQQVEDLKSLCVRGATPAVFSNKLSKAEASKRIDALKAKLNETGVNSN